MRELARREPTFALHVHVGVDDADEGIRLYNRMRAHLPLLLALSVNSPFWQGRDTGLGSARTPLFQAFPRVGIPRAFEDYADWVEAVDLLIRCDAFPEPTFLWWDVRPSRASARSRCASSTPRPRWPRPPPWRPWCSPSPSWRWKRATCRSGRAHPGDARREPLHRGPRRHGGKADRPGQRVSRAGPRRAPLLEACAPHAPALGCEAELEPIRRWRSTPAPGASWTSRGGARACRDGRAAGRCLHHRGVCSPRCFARFPRARRARSIRLRRSVRSRGAARARRGRAVGVLAGRPRRAAASAVPERSPEELAKALARARKEVRRAAAAAG